MQTNFLIIGSGISGLNFALHAAEIKMKCRAGCPAEKGRILIVTKKKIIDSSTNYAQGGIAAVLDKTDDIKQHVKDTLETGAYHNNKKAVKFMVKNSTAAVHRLVNLGVEFAKEKGQLKLTREGGHNKRRIAYVGDYTGKEIERILVKRVKENKNITILEDTFALKLLTTKNICFGAQIIHKNKIENILADQTILATGGIGELFQYTTNPPISTGDGIALGIAAGCKTRDLEFIQFHPTALAKDTYPRFLISETVRGEGAKLINKKSEYFMAKVHPLKDLAPRDIVAREIYAQMKNGPVFLDCRTKTTGHSTKFLKNRFPQIYKKLAEYGYKMEKDLIPVTPAAHYICGGIVTDLHGRVELKTSKTKKPSYLQNLFAFGEVTYTGVHGANRLASNSLLEALVFSNQIVEKLSLQVQTFIANFKSLPGHALRPPGTCTLKFPHTEAISISEKSKLTKSVLNFRQEIKHLMWQYAGIIRNRKEIKEKAIPKMEKIISGLEQLSGLTKNIKDSSLTLKSQFTNQTIAETNNMAKVGLLILQFAYRRQKSLGCHFVSEP